MIKNGKRTIFAVIAAAMVLCLASPVSAYIDPSTTSYIIQSVVAIFITAGAAVGIFWKKIRLAIKRKKMANLERKLAKEGEKRDNK